MLWYADIRGFTPLADATPGPVLIEMLDDVFEALTAALRPTGAQVLKFLGDGMLASFAFMDATCSETCTRALDAAAEAMRSIDRLNADRTRAGKPIAVVDLALHVGQVLYGNVGAVDRLDFTVIGPAVNEVARIETLCEPLVLCFASSPIPCAKAKSQKRDAAYTPMRQCRTESTFMSTWRSCSCGI